MIIDTQSFRKALELDDTLAIYAEFYNILEFIVYEVKNQNFDGEKEKSDSSILILTQIKGILLEIDEKIKENDKNGILTSLELLEGLCLKF